jgi:5-methyltetrahydropteroyltriglutamate--homocysteine methyltransferase
VKLLATTVVGSYPQPDWLIDRARLRDRPPPRARAAELWRVRAALLGQAQDDATLLAVRDMERAGIDLITDGEIRRESYSNRFANALSGIDHEHPGTAVGRSGRTPTGRSRSPARGRSRWPSWRRTSTTGTSVRWRSTSLPPSTRR